MKAAIINEFGPPSVLKFSDNFPAPKIEKPSQVLIRVHSAGVNPVETYIRAGATQIFKPLALPCVIGCDAAGVVEAVGAGVKSLKVGERVFCYGALGAYAELCVADELTTWILPDHLSFSQGASFGVPYFTAYKSLFIHCNAKKTDTVLVHGASGAVGIAAVQLCKAMNIKVLGTASSATGHKLIEEAGGIAFDHSKADYEKEIMAATGGSGVDVVIEMLANVNLDKDLGLMRMNGRCCIVGSRGSVQINPSHLMMKELMVCGILLGANTSPEHWKEMGLAMGKLNASKQLNPIVGKEYPLSEAAQCHIDVIEQKGGAKGKLVLKIN